MDDAGGLRRGVAAVYGPRAHFLDAGGEVGLQAEQVVAGVHQAVEARFLEAEVGEENLLFVVVEVGDLGFDRRADGDDFGILGGGVHTHGVQMRVVLEAVLGDVGRVEHRLGGDQAERLEVQPLLLRQVERAHRPALVELGEAFFEHGNEDLGFLVAGARRPAVAQQRFLDGGHVDQRQLGIDDLDVAQRIDTAGNVNHVVIGEAAHHVQHGVGFADVGEELVAQPFPLGGAGDQPGDIDELGDRRHDALRLDDLRQLVEALVGHFDDADRRIDGAERVVLSGDAGLGQRVEQGGLANVGQTDDSAFEAHDEIPVCCVG